jgi:hypothetical protein
MPKTLQVKEFVDSVQNGGVSVLEYASKIAGEIEKKNKSI